MSEYKGVPISSSYSQRTPVEQNNAPEPSVSDPFDDWKCDLYGAFDGFREASQSDKSETHLIDKVFECLALPLAPSEDLKKVATSTSEHGRNKAGWPGKTNKGATHFPSEAARLVEKDDYVEVRQWVLGRKKDPYSFTTCSFDIEPLKRHLNNRKTLLLSTNGSPKTMRAVIEFMPVCVTSEHRRYKSQYREVYWVHFVPDHAYVVKNGIIKRANKYVIARDEKRTHIFFDYAENSASTGMGREKYKRQLDWFNLTDRVFDRNSWDKIYELR